MFATATRNQKTMGAIWEPAEWPEKTMVARWEPQRNEASKYVMENIVENHVKNLMNNLVKMS